MPLSVVTANRLHDGVVVWWTGRSWAEHFEDAAVLQADQAEPALATARAEVGRQVVVGVYAAAVRREGGRVLPESVRETIRARGPSVRPDLGVQATVEG